MTKMPEPAIRLPHGRHIVETVGETMPFYTTDQLKQYGRDLLEEAIQRFESRTNVVFSAQRIQEELRKMKETI